MKRLAFPLPILCVALLLPGCPIYGDDDDGPCYSDLECASGYVCDQLTGFCTTGSAQCDRPVDCAENQTCSRGGVCRSGDCTFSGVGCVAGYVCASPRGVWECVLDEGAGGEGGSSGSASGGAGEPGAGAGGAAPVDPVAGNGGSE